MKIKITKALTFILVFTTNQFVYANHSDVSLKDLNNWTLPLMQNNFDLNIEVQEHIPLFKMYSELQRKIPHLKLGDFPTPVKTLDNLEKDLNVKKLYFKDDALTKRPFGGNKIRKLEFLLADAINNGSKSVITVGDAGSNCTLATILSAQELGLKAFSMLTPQIGTSYLRRNLLLSLHFDGSINYFEEEDARDEKVIEMILKKDNASEPTPYFIPSGASNDLGSVGYVNAAFELKDQIDKGIILEPDYIYITQGSSGTGAGLILGLQLAGIKSKIVLVRISGTPGLKEAVLKDLYDETTRLLNSLDPLCPLMIFPEDKVIFEHNFSGEQYAQATKEGNASILKLYEAEDFKLEGTYTGKTLSALFHDLKRNKLSGKVVLFWNTFSYGSYEEVIKDVDYKKLPSNLHFYFETEIQALDAGV